MATNGRVRSVWTPENEAQLMGLLARKKRIMEEKTDAVRDAMQSVELEHDDFDIVVGYLINNADKVVTALKPFTSGS